MNQAEKLELLLCQCSEPSICEAIGTHKEQAEYLYEQGVRVIDLDLIEEVMVEAVHHKSPIKKKSKWAWWIDPATPSHLLDSILSRLK